MTSKPDNKQLAQLTLKQMLNSQAVTLTNFQTLGTKPRSIIEYIRHIERVPVRTKRRINTPAQSTERRLTAWDMLPEEIHRYEHDRLNQIADMVRQSEQRQHRNECRRAKQLLEKLGLEVPEAVEAGAALYVPDISEGKSI